MHPDRWKQIGELAGLAAESEPSEREVILASQPGLRSEVESLLLQLERGPGPLDEDPWLVAEVAGPLAGRHIGPYEVLSEIGSGGMGMVLLARRANATFEQRVALKLARIAFQSEVLAARFLEEQRILARLEHPNIARLLDGGLAEDGTPYFAMQYVEGEPLDQWCNVRALPLAGRLELFLKICGAVQYAHEHLVVHRDLKPSNILVTERGEPMLLDFGTARLVEPGGGTTRTGLPLMTLRYASPEQVEGLSGSTRSDVYSLSMVLYELLTGHWAYAPPGDECGAPCAAAIRAVLEGNAIPPSHRQRSIPQDLDAILLKGLSRDPAHRYGTAGQLADDLRRYLSHELVVARRPSWRYRTGRFLWRHRGAALGASAVICTLAFATAWSIRQARIAEAGRATAEEVSMFAERLLGASRSGEMTPLAARGRDLTVVEIIDAAARNAGTDFRDKPAVEAGLRSTIGSTYMALGEYGKAAEHVERAVELARRLHGDRDPATARAWISRGKLRMSAGDWAGARNDFDASLAILERAKSPDLSFLHSLLGEATFRLGEPAAARRHFETALVSMRRQFGTNHIATATMINNVAVVAEEAGDQDAAARGYTEAATVLRGLPGPPPNTVYPLIGLQRDHFYRGEYAQARRICEEALRIAVAHGGEKNRNASKALLQLALVMAHLGESAALSTARCGVGMQRELYPAEHFEVAAGLAVLGRVLLRMGKSAEAEAKLRDALRITGKTFPKAHWRNAEARAFLGSAVMLQSRAGEGRELLEAAIREMEAVLPASHPKVAEVRALLSPNPGFKPNPE